MIALSSGGVYLVDGMPVSRQDGFPSPSEGRSRTMAYSILHAHNSSENPNQFRITFDALASHDITYVGIIQTARASGLQEFPRALCDDKLPQQSVCGGRDHQ